MAAADELVERIDVRRRWSAAVLVIAHRGASAELPENTLPAFERAIEIGADYVELDVWNGLEVTHDRAASAAARTRRSPRSIELCRGRIGLMVELKRPRGDTVERALRLLDDDDVLVSLPAPRARGGARAAPEDPHRAARRLRRLDPPAPPAAWAAGFQDERVTRRAASRRRRRSASRRPSTRSTTTARMLELRDLGVTGVFTDDPTRALPSALR